MDVLMNDAEKVFVALSGRKFRKLPTCGTLTTYELTVGDFTISVDHFGRKDRSPLWSDYSSYVFDENNNIVFHEDYFTFGEAKAQALSWVSFSPVVQAVMSANGEI